MTRVELHNDYGSLADMSLTELRATLLEEAANCRDGPLVLELSKVRYVGAAFLGVLIEVDRRIRSRGWQMALVNVGPGMSTLFQVTKTENWFAEDRMNEPERPIDGHGVLKTMSETEILQRVDLALVMLLEAYQYAQATGRDPWDFAVEIDDLREAGATDSDLRYLICAGFAEHATEVTRQAWRKRAFRKLHNLGMTNKTCLVLTERGESFLHQAGLSVARSIQIRDGRNTDGGLSQGASNVAVPCWDRLRRELRVGDHVVKRFTMPACNQETILIAFEEEGWPVRIDDPLPPLNDQEPKKRLHDAINKLNRNQKERLLKFRGDGTGRGIRWELRPELPSAGLT